MLTHVHKVVITCWCWHISTTSEVGIQTEVNGGHRGDRTLHRTRPVSSMQQSGARVLGFATGVSDHSWDWRVRSGAQRELKLARSIERAVRSVTRDRTRPVVEGAYWTPTGRWHCHVQSLPRARPVDASWARGTVRSACPIS
jgi:hypothetical protein